MVGQQGRRLRPLQDEVQQLGPFQDAKNQVAVTDVVGGQRRLVLLVAMLDFRHLVVCVTATELIDQKFPRVCELTYFCQFLSKAGADANSVCRPRRIR